jgi:hypothetical protein
MPAFYSTEEDPALPERRRNAATRSAAEAADAA